MNRKDKRVKTMKSAPSNGVKSYNQHRNNFGNTYYRDQRHLKADPLRYKLIPSDLLKNVDNFSSTERWKVSDDYYHHKIYEALQIHLPGQTWIVLSVNGDGNCFPHCGAGYMEIVEPRKKHLHFFYSFRHQLCDAVEAHLEDAGSPVEGMDMMSFCYQSSFVMADVPDITGKDARAEVKRDLVKLLEDTRKLGVDNTEMHLLAMAIVTRKIVKVFNFNAESASFALVQNIEMPGNDGQVLPLFLKPELGGGHWTTAVPLEAVDSFRVPRGAELPKNPDTHDEKGMRRMLKK